MNQRKFFAIILALIMIFVLSFFFTSCTINISLTDTHGSATDVGDTKPTTEVQTDPEAIASAVSPVSSVVSKLVGSK